MAAKGMPGVMARAKATTVKFGTVKKSAARADISVPGAIVAPAAGAVAVVSAAADDLQTLGALVVTLRGQVATQATAFNDLLAKLRTANILA